jgi:hypothetical protein
MVMLALPLHTCTSGPVALRAMCLRGDDRHQLLLNNVFGYIGNLRNWLPGWQRQHRACYMAVSRALWMAGLSGADRVRTNRSSFFVVFRTEFHHE